MTGQPERPLVCAQIGVGNIGAPIAISMARGGFETRAVDPRPDRLAHVEEHGVVPNASRASAVAGADVVGVAVMGDADVMALLEDGLLSEMSEGATLLILSTVMPETCEHVAALALDIEINVLDAPISGSLEAAYRGELTVMVGGPKQVVDSCRPVLGAIASQIFHVSERVGSGAAAKIVNNSVSLASLAALLEALRLGERSGIEVEELIRIIRASTGSGFWSEQWPLPVEWVAKHPLGELAVEAAMVKDLRHAVELAADHRLELPVADAAAASLNELLLDRYRRHEF